MKTTAKHPVHPEVIVRLEALHQILAEVYQSGDFALSLSVEGQIVSAVNTKVEVAPVAWPADVVAEQVELRKLENLDKLESKTDRTVEVAEPAVEDVNEVPAAGKPVS